MVPSTLRDFAHLTTDDALDLVDAPLGTDRALQEGQFRSRKEKRRHLNRGLDATVRSHNEWGECEGAAMDAFDRVVKELKEAAAQGDMKRVRQLMHNKHMCDERLVRQAASAALFMAVDANQPFVVEATVAGWSPNLNAGPVKCIELAAAQGNRDMVRLLLDLGANVDYSQALGYAARNGHTELVKYLVEERGAQVGNYKPAVLVRGRYNTPLHHAVVAGRIDLCDYLIRHGADTEIKCSSLPGPFDDANLVTAQQDRRLPDLDPRNMQQWQKVSCKTPLEVAAQLQNLPLVSLLLELGADPSFDIVVSVIVRGVTYAPQVRERVSTILTLLQLYAHWTADRLLGLPLWVTTALNKGTELHNSRALYHHTLNVLLSLDLPLLRQCPVELLGIVVGHVHGHADRRTRNRLRKRQRRKNKARCKKGGAHIQVLGGKKQQAQAIRASMDTSGPCC